MLHHSLANTFFYLKSMLHHLLANNSQLSMNCILQFES